jgi:hypothetical protein
MVLGTHSSHPISLATSGLSRLSIDKDGNVGIATGAAKPAARLEIGGTGGTTVDLLVNGRIRSNSNDGGLWVADKRFVGGVGADKIGFFTSDAWRLTVDGKGSVGIGTGTATPAAKLEVKGGGGTSIDLLVNGRIKSSAEDGGLWVGDDRFVGGIGSGTNAGKIGVWNGNDWRMTVDADGNVGVGTGLAVPAAKLEVKGAGGTTVDLLVNGRIRSNSNDGGLWVGEDRFVGGLGRDKVGFFNRGEWRLTVDPTGNVGIGTNTPVGRLDVNGEICKGGVKTLQLVGIFQEYNNISTSAAWAPGPSVGVKSTSYFDVFAQAYGPYSWGNSRIRFYYG